MTFRLLLPQITKVVTVIAYSLVLIFWFVCGYMDIIG